jgi:hypothetical protein
MAAPETPTALGPCPTDEDLAAFLDGTLSKADRERVIAHLANCETCYEIFVGSVHFLQDNPPAEAVGEVLPFVSKKEGGGGGIRRWLPAVAAAVLVAALGFGGYRALFDRPLQVDTLIRPLAGRVAGKGYDVVYRGGSDESGILSDSPDFMAGVYLVDLRLDLAAKKAARASEKARQIAAQLQKADFVEDALIASFQHDATTLQPSSPPDALKKVETSLPAREETLDESLKDSFQFGKWTETGRLAAEVGSRDFFGWRNRWYLRRFLKDKNAYEAGVAEHLDEIQKIWDRGDFKAQDYKDLSRSFGDIIQSYDLE